MGESDNVRWYYSPIAISIIVFVLVTAIVIVITGYKVLIIKPDFIWGLYNKSFLLNVLVEAHGMLFDILVIGILILSLNRLAEKRVANQRYIDEIDDFRDWKEPEAAYRIAGNIKRLNKNGYKGKINLGKCYLKDTDLAHTNLNKANLRRANLQGVLLNGADLQGANLSRADLCGANLNAYLWVVNSLKSKLTGEANLQGADLQGANLSRTNLQGANLSRANLQEANLKEANLKEANLLGALNLKIEQLSEAKNLYEAKLDPELEKQVKEKYPHLLEAPKPKDEKPDDVRKE